jgi:myosin heavy subunit
VGDPRQFHYLNQSDCFEVDRINDYQEYMDMRNAMDIVGMNAEEQVNFLAMIFPKTKTNFICHGLTAHNSMVT